jgi:quercetin dioxygenase-like cupin family protein
MPPCLRANQIKEIAMKISNGADRATFPGPEAWFTGDVSVEMLFTAEEPGRTSSGRVTFQPGARTAWHAHPYGQALIVTEGRGLAQQWGDPVQEIEPGDVVRFPAGEKHWHGAAPDSAMTHIAIQEAQDGTEAEWMEKVSDEQYRP